MNRARLTASMGGLVIFISLFQGCTGGREVSDHEMRRMSREYTVGATLWFQRAAEAHALYYQAYALARLRLDEALRQGAVTRPAVILDIDETVLDNSPYQAKLILEGESYSPVTWKRWTAMADANALPGAVGFLRHADSLGVAIFFVTNRDADEAGATLRNLQREGVPQATGDHLLTRQGASSKESRRGEIAQDHDIVLLIGDNLADFSAVFERRSVDDRSRLVDSLRSSFGERFVIVPNPMYGDWEAALYGYNWSLSDSVRALMRMQQLMGY
jgi:5'-nucleotidase (lipoprotein e(P4) family)